MARVRVYLTTFRRPALLRRALRSLLAQTFADWVCELHNDDPADPEPATILTEIAAGDARIVLHQHERNLGAVSTFNLAFAGADEPFVALLEDDNWWEPMLLERLLAALAAHPEAEMAWANMQVWHETSDGGWSNDARTLWPVVNEETVALHWPQMLQFDGPLHSNGAMLARSDALIGGRLQSPPQLPLDIVENLRDRLFYPPLVLVPEPLANFAMTRETVRRQGHGHWVRLQTLLAAAALKHFRPPDSVVSKLWTSRRTARPPATSPLIFAGLVQRTPGFLRHATARDWWRFAKGVIRHPRAAIAALSAKRFLPELWRLLDKTTAEAMRRPQPGGGIPPYSLVQRGDLKELIK